MAIISFLREDLQEGRVWEVLAFASKEMSEENRSAVQIPDPFQEKLLMEATLEAVEKHLVKALKDLGGGGLSCCLSELSHTLEKGFDIDLSKIHSKEKNLEPAGLMVSESQERMLFVTDSIKLKGLRKTFRKYDLSYSLIGRVKDHSDLVLKFKGKIVGKMPSSLISNAPLAQRSSERPRNMDKIQNARTSPEQPSNLHNVLLSMLSDPSIASKSWIYEQYDHEVGTRTVIKPGSSDASVLRLTDNKFISVKLDGNSKQCYLDPYNGYFGLLIRMYKKCSVYWCRTNRSDRPPAIWKSRKPADILVIGRISQSNC